MSFFVHLQGMRNPVLKLSLWHLLWKKHTASPQTNHVIIVILNNGDTSIYCITWENFLLSYIRVSHWKKKKKFFIFQAGFHCSKSCVLYFKRQNECFAVKSPPHKIWDLENLISQNWLHCDTIAFVSKNIPESFIWHNYLLTLFYIKMGVRSQANLCSYPNNKMGRGESSARRWQRPSLDPSQWWKRTS